MWSTTTLLVLLSFGVTTAYSADANSDVIAQKFLDRMVRSIESKDVAVISGLFEPDFVLKGCKGVYDKTKIIALLEKLPTGTKFSFTLKSSQDTGSSIKYTVSITGFDKNEVIAEFILNKKDQQLESGSVPACQKKNRFARATEPTALARTNSFFNELKTAVMQRDMVGLKKLFANSFYFKDCKSKHHEKEAVLDALKRVDTENPFDFEVIQAKYTQYTATIDFTVKIYGVSNDFTADGALQYNQKVLLGATYTKCN